MVHFNQNYPIVLPQTELLGIAITLQPQTDCYLRPQYPTALHGWFLDRVRSTNPTLSQQLHDGQEEKPFTISGFAGEIPTLDRQLLLSKDRSYQWQITALSVPLCYWFREWLAAPPHTLRLNSTTCQITDWQLVLPPTTYTQIWDRSATDNRPLELTFTSPTSFRKRKNHMPLPIPENIFQSYLRRWNYFSPHQFNQDNFLDWVNDCIVILRHDIRSSKVQAGKSGSVTGFVGSIQLGLTAQAQRHPEYSQLARALVACAPYFQTGHKVTFGLGQTRLGWSAELGSFVGMTSRHKITDKTAIVAARSELIIAREQELEPIFLDLKIRQGGQRASKSAKLWAQIIARQEMGDSLRSIAADLKMPYDTVKKYAQLAKKNLRSSISTET
jgi:CRISPR-associated endoribonuclease Cas6